MEKDHPMYRFSDVKRQILEDVYQKDVKDAATNTKLLEKMLGHETERATALTLRERSKDRSISSKGLPGKQHYFTFGQQKQLKVAFERDPWMKRNEAAALAKKFNIENGELIRAWFRRKRRIDDVPPRIILFSKKEKAYLLATQAKNAYPNKEEINEMAKELSVPGKRIKHWFQNKRSQDKRFGSGEPQDTRLNSQQTNSRSIHRTFYTEKQNLALKDAYQKSKYLTKEELDALEETTGLERIQIRRWLYHERSKNINPEDFSHVPHQKFEIEKIPLLEEAYQKNKYMRVKEMYALADSMDITHSRIYKWFIMRKRTDGGYKGTAWKHSADQIRILEVAYKSNPRPSMEEKEKIANEVGISVIQIQNWFLKARKRYNHTNNRVHFTPQQKIALINAYKKNTYPTKETMAKLANRAGIKESCVKRWFRNHRCRTKRLNATNCEQLKPEEGFDEDRQDLKVETNVKVEPMDVDDTDQKKLLQ